ncbi:winged helix DNA-binding domain-containing protein [Exidia glandulosa HHB12029]|uniref:Winged helix DNA-binding domain-containing protein n=1 Tax=Exidia glandulosa HHB12029 TaxID=1314781 RepID=A0A165HZ69_EXIGL|nr:winged helix DNA-binding domain-containing protein [Exidia glandulosa HHB12029]
MHRRAGIAGLERKNLSREAYSALQTKLSQQQLDAMQTQVDHFRTALQRFARSHRADILRSPTLRGAFVQMCTSIGVDPLQGAGPSRNKLAELTGLGLGEWQAELGVQVCDVCIGTRDRNGGLIEMPELVRILCRMRGLGEDGEGGVNEDDVVRAIRSLKPLGAGYEVVTVGDTRFVRSVPRELDVDQTALLGLAKRNGGVLDEDSVVQTLGWTNERARAGLENMLLRDGMCWVDEQDPRGLVYYVPSVMVWEDD